MDLSREERDLQTLLRVWTVLFVLGGLAFLLLGGRWLRDTSLAAGLFGPDGLGPAPGIGVEELGLVFAVAMMGALAAASWIAARDVRGNRAAVLPVIVAEIAASLLGLLFFGLSAKGPFLGIFVTGLMMAIPTVWLYRRAVAAEEDETRILV